MIANSSLFIGSILTVYAVYEIWPGWYCVLVAGLIAVVQGLIYEAKK